MSARFYDPFSSVVSNSNKLLAGGLIDTFENNTTTLKQTFTDEALVVPHTNPIIINAAGRFPTIFAADEAVFTLRLRDSSGATVIGIEDDYSGVSEFSLTSAQVLAALASNSDDVVINGDSMSGTSFLAFASALDLTAAGSIDASLGSIILGTVSGATTFSSALTVDSGGIAITTGNLVVGDGNLNVTRAATGTDSVADFAGTSTAGGYIRIVESGIKGWAIGIDDGTSTLNIREDNPVGTITMSFDISNNVSIPNGDLIIRSTGAILNAAANSFGVLSGGQTSILGGNVKVYGNTHGSLPSFTEIYANGVLTLQCTNVNDVVLPNGGLKISDLAGTGTRTVVVDANGLMSAP